jgi:lysophospholipase L1-like esterase
MRLRVFLVAVVGLGMLAGTTGVFAATGGAGGIDQPATCCEPAMRLLPPSSNVVVIGDSLFAGIVWSSFLGVDNTIQARLRATGRTVLADAAIGRSVPGGLRSVAANRAAITQADVALIGLGTNEVLDTPGLDVATSRAAIDRMVSALREANPHIRIVWVDVTVEGLLSRTQNWNLAMAGAETQIANFEVCRWRHIALAQPDWFEPDGVHLKIPGYVARRDVLINCVIIGS